MVGLVTNTKETAYREEVQSLVSWCHTNNLILNTKKTKEIIIDFGKHQNTNYNSLVLHGEEMEQVSGFKYLGVHLAEDLTWRVNTRELVKRHSRGSFSCEP